MLRHRGRPKSPNPLLIEAKARIDAELDEQLQKYCIINNTTRTNVLRKGLFIMLNRKEIHTVYIQHDFETSERAGAGGMFQVIEARGVGEDFDVVFKKIDCGVHYSSNEDVLRDIIDYYPEFDFSSTNVEDDD